MNSIGGFFEIEIGNGKNVYHKNAIALNTGRGCFNLLLKYLSPKIVYLPYYTCNSLVLPIIENEIEYTFYEIDDKLEVQNDFDLVDRGLILYINYFGLKSEYIKTLTKKYGPNLVIDNTQAFFEKDIKGLNSFNSARKFFGVPDGAYLYSSIPNITNLVPNINISYDYLINKLIGYSDLAFEQYQSYEKSITNQTFLISEFSRKLLSNVDYDLVANIRYENFLHYDSILANYNNLDVKVLSNQVPMCYPFLPQKNVSREDLLKHNVFIPQYWEEVITRHQDGFEREKYLSKYLIPLPLDQRYGSDEIKRVSEIILQLL